ncbi:ThiF family adenylyltransferase [Peribacillus muralis]|uniref:HesA/MoeB/ThiF family protein n=1 Tax=Peribacillus muralis TaxID=264697 RepID=UPI001F4DE205|nr:ThiF family adenylyltransferase [Peribacillus muralis]MCK1994220.1 ThiF family adenylyltransferase [Peribacillus muralis]MCK2014995.1 ThiF family adenylyltransferase [Peribacillus muralis]
MLKLLKDLDGNTDIEELALRNDLSYSETIEILEDLSAYGVIYENISSNFDFTNEEESFYDRNLNFFAWIDVNGKYYNYWKVQNKLKSANILLLGAGGTGGSCAISLARMGFGNITVVDFDKVELSNLNRQIYTFEDVGENKVNALLNHLNNINPFINVIGVKTKIDTVDDLLVIGSSFDLVICCIDKPMNINSILEEYTCRTRVPRVLGGYASTILTNAPFTKESYSYTKMFKENSEQNYDTQNVNLNIHEWKWNNAIISPVANISGNFSALYALYFITGLGYLELGQVNHIDLLNIQNKHFSYSIDENGLVNKGVL